MTHYDHKPAKSGEDARQHAPDRTQGLHSRRVNEHKRFVMSDTFPADGPLAQ